jgi:hypothetical protein
MEYILRLKYIKCLEAHLNQAMIDVAEKSDRFSRLY